MKDTLRVHSEHPDSAWRGDVVWPGTAVGIAMVEAIGNNDFTLTLPEANPVSHMVNDTLNAMKVQQEADPFGWIVPAQ